MREGTLDLTGQLSWYFLYGMKLTATRDQSIEKSIVTSIEKEVNTMGEKVC